MVEQDLGRGVVPLVREIWLAVRLSCTLALYATTTMVPLLWFWSGIALKCFLYKAEFVKNPGTQALMGVVDYSVLEPVVLKGFASNFSLFFDFPFSYIILLVYFPLGARFYLGKEWLPTWKLLLVVFGSYFIVVGGFGYLEIYFFLDMLPLIPILSLIVVLYKTLPGGSMVTLYVWRYACVLILGIGFLQIFKFLPENSDETNLVRYLVIYPVLREMMRALSTNTAYRLSTNSVLVEKDLNVKQEYGWVFSSIVYQFFATFYRFQVVNIEDSTMMTLVILYQAVTEIALRLTMYRRDEWMNQFTKFGKRQAKVVALDTRLRTAATDRPVSLIVESDYEKRKSKKCFYAIVILNEMIAEYCGIIIATVILILSRNYMLAVPYSWYSTFDDPFRQQIDVSHLISFCGLQLAVEVCVDSLCVFYETRYVKMELQHFWKFKPKYFLVFTMLSGWYGLVSADAFFSEGDVLTECLGSNLCCCLNNGLRVGGLREKYCLLSNLTNLICE